MVENPGRYERYISWELIQGYVKKTIPEIKKKFPGLKYVYGLPRGGLPVAVLLSHVMKLRFIGDVDDLEMYPIEQILITDDISDGGCTLENLFEQLKCKYQTYTIFVREGTRYMPDIYSELIVEDWLVFPWEVLEDECEKN